MPRVFVLIATIGFALGLILGVLINIAPSLLLAVAVLAIRLWTRRGTWLVIFTIALTLGMWRVQFTQQKLERDTTAILQATSPLSGLVVRASEQYGRQSLDLTQLRQEVGGLNGGVRVTSSDITSIVLGDRMRIDCRWAPLDFAKRRRGQSQGILAECRNPRTLEILGRDQTWRGWLARSRGGVVRRINRQYHHPQSDLLAGILLGVQESMSADLRTSFRATGTSHIVALSGFNVTIIITLLATLLSTLVGRRLAIWPMMVLIGGFVIMTGASASVTRAAVMAVIVLTAQQLGRPVAPSRLLCYAFLIMTLVNPLILQYDLGFQLSFLATIGLVYLTPLIEIRVGWLPTWGAIRGNLSSTLGAMAATEPLLLWEFGRLSIVAPLVNMLVLPFVPLIMALGTVALIVGWAAPVTDALLRFVLGSITTAGGWPFAQIVTPWWLAGGLAASAVAAIVHWSYDAAKKNSPR